MSKPTHLTEGHSTLDPLYPSTPMLSEQRATLAASAEINADGEFEILAITAGVGNGWTFGEETLKASLPMWEGVNTFIDHGSLWQGRSVRDLCGGGTGPGLDEQTRGI